MSIVSSWLLKLDTGDSELVITIRLKLKGLVGCVFFAFELSSGVILLLQGQGMRIVVMFVYLSYTLYSLYFYLNHEKDNLIMVC